MSSKEDPVISDKSLPQKLCHPPPKPPRRRHSDQFAVSLSGSYMCNRKKNIDGNVSHSTKMTALISTYGSESLPPDWIPESPKIKLKKEKSLLKKSEHNSLKVIKPFFQVSPLEKKNFGRNVTVSQDNKLNNSFLLLKYSQPADHLHVTKPNLKYANHIPDKEKSSICGSKFCSDLTNSAFKQVGGSKIIHRRHHSDPLISKFNKSFKTVSNVKLKRAIFETTPLDFSVKDARCAFSKEDSSNSSESKIQKEINDKLWQHLCLLQAKLDSLQHSQISPKSDESVVPSFAELMFDVYNAQKEKDIAVQNRLNAALDMRDTAIQELEEILQIVARNFEADDSSDDECGCTNKELAQFFKEFEAMENPAKIIQQQRILLSYLYQAKESKIQQLTCALKLAEQERDTAILKMKELEDELCKARSSSCLLHANAEVIGSKWEGSLLDTIFDIVSQRDSAFAKIKSLQEQISSYHNQQSNPDYSSFAKVKLSPSIQDASQQTLVHEQQNEMKDVNHFEVVADDIEHLKSELNNLTHLFNDEVKKRQRAEGNCQRLQRMLNFLLEKVNGLNIGVPV